MSEPSLRARELFQISRDLNRPTVADRERIQKALRARLGVAVFPVPTHGAPDATSLPWSLASTVVMGAFLITVALLFTFRQRSRAGELVRNAAVPIAASGSAAVALAPPAESITGSTSPTVAPPIRSPSAARSTEDPLAQEVALLGRAVIDLHAGRLGEALKVLDEHRRKFPMGILTEERRAARAQALCLLGRRGEADGELAELPPRSITGARAKKVCDATTKSAR